MKKYKCKFCGSIVEFYDEEFFAIINRLDEINNIINKKGSSSSLLFEELLDKTMLCCTNKDYRKL